MSAIRIKTYVNGLDDRMQGGVPEKYIVLVCGHAGTMKSTFTYSMLYRAAIEEQRKGMYLDRYMGNRLLRAVTRDDLRAYRLWLEKNGFKKPLSPQSVAHILSDARCFFNWCEDSGLAFIVKSAVPGPQQNDAGQCSPAAHGMDNGRAGEVGEAELRVKK